MRIAFVSLMAGSPWAASEALWAETAHRALAAGHRVFVSTYFWPQQPQALAELARDGALLDSRPSTRWVRRSAIASRLARTFTALETFKPDVICLSQGGTYDVARSGSTAVLRRTLKHLSAPYVVLCHCEQPAPPARIVSHARAVFEQAAIVGFVGKRALDIAELHLGISLPKARIFHNPVNLDRITRLPWPQQSSPLRLAFVGRLEPVKNLQALLIALTQDRWVQRDWTLTVFGSGSLRSELESFAANSSLASRCTFAGYATDISSVWANHHALILPSRFEGVPLALIEALLCGRPAIATNTGGIAEWIQSGETGFLIRDAGGPAIADALERLWERRGDLETMGALAHSRTLEKRDPDPVGTLLDWLTTNGNRTNAVTEPLDRRDRRVDS
ncbi:MAG TPA: glycosyltransferase family 4 protein [Povalibacter sp.]|uniref:glycosyltransferase family 4 protein n=1 Tax=Povalibacter sp. TaxID=1962978 RepID=UPI002BA46226|nr:glycosyltransferase family 4 protein [Povalibacter sp.]HMN45318.1 glycosyltransferase family 4 protein [Povalibacter sp.]